MHCQRHHVHVRKNTLVASNQVRPSKKLITTDVSAIFATGLLARCSSSDSTALPIDGDPGTPSTGATGPFTGGIEAAPPFGH